MGAFEAISYLVWEKLSISKPEYKAAINRAYSYIAENTCVDTKCPLCGKKAIKSHAISKSLYLRTIAKNNKVIMLKPNQLNALEDYPSEVAIKLATTFPGFCKKHDSVVFEPIETHQIANFTHEHVFLYCLRTAAMKHYESRKNKLESHFIRKQRKTAQIEEATKMIEHIAWEKLCLNHMKWYRQAKGKKAVFVVWKMCKRLTLWKCLIQGELYSKQEVASFGRCLNHLTQLWKEKQFESIQFEVFEIKARKIAFATAIASPTKKNHWAFVFVLPNANTSHVIVACLKGHYDYFYRKGLFNLDNVEKIIDVERNHIVFNPNVIEEDLLYHYVRDRGVLSEKLIRYRLLKE